MVELTVAATAAPAIVAAAAKEGQEGGGLVAEELVSAVRPFCSISCSPVCTERICQRLGIVCRDAANRACTQAHTQHKCAVHTSSRRMHSYQYHRNSRPSPHPYRACYRYGLRPLGTHTSCSQLLVTRSALLELCRGAPDQLFSASSGTNQGGTCSRPVVHSCHKRNSAYKEGRAMQFAAAVGARRARRVHGM